MVEMSCVSLAIDLPSNSLYVIEGINSKYSINFWSIKMRYPIKFL